MSRKYSYRPGIRDTTTRVVVDEYAGGDDEQVLPELNVAQPVTYSEVVNETVGPDSSREFTLTSTPGTIYTRSVDEILGLTSSRTANLSQSGAPNFATYGNSQHSSRGNTAQSFAFYDTFLNNPPAYRKFFSAGLGTTSDADISAALSRNHIKYLSISWKGGQAHPSYQGLRIWTTSEVDAFFASLPAPDHRVYQLTWWHEPAGDWSTTAQLADFRQRWRDLATYIRNKDRADVLAGPILNGFTFDYPPSNAKHWSVFWPGNGYCDFLGIDQYSRSTPTEGTVNNPGSGYQTAEEMIDPLQEAWLQTDATFWSIHEIASRLSPGDSGDGVSPPYLCAPDPTGEIRSQYYQEWIDKIDSLNGDCRVVYYWEAALQKDGYYKDYRLDTETGDFSRSVWAAACAASRIKNGL